ncbi:hypothetical protein N5J23_04960 [Comamonas aquatica]|uniref:Uncharacterized protein n=1 Tax=Comamonas aquatica TaxID=225991 RepID=A0AA42W272_9BURK|nr:hypothetical protein [Comamonas aquatica]MDH1429138.1 hypothetical protein [Comamonas aquatica]MDH1605015.1 hypothetical protein [Comamonas aquatica]MDH1616039.1 hypothetical protein [Comamonas aquatica]MDH2004904.1 hypothetical protein [Comamonas aquatica]
MTHHTDAERALFEAVASDDGKWPQAIERDAKGNYLLLTTANGWMWWQAARRAPAAPVPQGWIDPNDKAQKQYLPHIGERVLFKHDGRVYLGKHTGGSFKAEYPFGKTFGTWDCMWMYPSALDAAAPQPPEATVNQQLTVEAAPVQMPDPAGWIDDGGMVFWNDGRKPNDGEIIYTEQQVRELLADHGIQERST